MCCALDMPCGARGIYIISKRSYIEWAQPIYRFCGAKISTKCLIPGVFQASGIFKLFLLTKDPPTGFGEKFFHEIHPGDPVGLAVEIFQGAGLRLEGEGQLIGIEGLIGPVEALIELTVLAVAQQRMTGVGELGANLVGPAGDQLALHQGKAVSRIQYLIIGLAGFAAGLRAVGDEDPVFLGVLEKIPLQAALLLLRNALDDGEVALVQLPVLDLLVHHAQGICQFTLLFKTLTFAVFKEVTF